MALNANNSGGKGSRIALTAALIVSLLIVFSCAHTKDAVLDYAKDNYERYGWFGPATSAIEDFTWIYYRNPESTDELLRFIDLHIELNGKYSYWGIAKYLKDDIKKKPDNFVFYQDSCLFYPHECPDTVIYVSIYSPKYILERINSEETKDRVLILNHFSTIFYDENDFWLPYDYKITEDLLRSFLNDKPDIHKIMFFAPLVF